MKSKYLISYSIDSITNIIGYEYESERDTAYRQYTETGILIANGTHVRPDQICALDTVACAEFRLLQ